MKASCASKSILCSLIAVLSAGTAVAQTFSSGSTGADGALTFNTPGTYVFDPKTYTPPLNPAGDNIFNFTTITIAAGVTVQVRGDVLNGPVVWLAQGAVKIDGTLDLSGQNGFSATNTTQRTNTIPGAGGYGGGYPSVGPNPAGAGLGPAGGAIAGNCNNWAFSGGFTGNQFLVPILGGSGGGGYGGYAGGAGGGAILIASTVSISGVGNIRASGGSSAQSVSGGGAGGGIRLVAPTVSLSGNLNVSGAGNSCGGASNGIIRIEGFQIGAINATGTLYTGTPFGLFLSTAGLPSVKVVSLGGIPVATPPTGTFTVPDVTVNSNGPLAVAIEAANVPVGTVVTLQIFSENGPDQTIQSTALAGTLAASTATASVTLPSGFSKGFVKATFTQ